MLNAGIRRRVWNSDPGLSMKSPTYDLKFERTPEYLCASVTGKNNSENVFNYIKGTLEECARQSCENLLIIENLQGARLKDYVVVDILYKLMNTIRVPFHKVAYIDLAADATSSMTLAVHIANYKGINIKRFSTVQDASQWLTADKLHE
jgi:hypothetical protein